VVDVVVDDVDLDRCRFPADMAARNQTGSPSTVRATRVTPAQRKRRVPRRDSSRGSGSGLRPESTSAAGSVDGRTSRGRGTGWTPA